MLRLLPLVLAASFPVPRVDFDLHPGTLAFIVLCIALVGGVLAAIVVLSLYTEDRKRNAAHHDAWIDSSDPSDQHEPGSAKPFIPDEATPNVSPTVNTLFGSETDEESDVNSKPRSGTSMI